MALKNEKELQTLAYSYQVRSNSDLSLISDSGERDCRPLVTTLTPPPKASFPRKSKSKLKKLIKSFTPQPHPQNQFSREFIELYSLSR